MHCAVHVVQKYDATTDLLSLVLRQCHVLATLWCARTDKVLQHNRFSPWRSGSTQCDSGTKSEGEKGFFVGLLSGNVALPRASTW